MHQVPSTSSIASQSCTNANLQRGNPPSGITWYWRTNPAGTSTSNSNSTYLVSSSGRYYLRAEMVAVFGPGSSSVYITLGTIGGMLWYADNDEKVWEILT